jgi:hypothetical protein
VLGTRWARPVLPLYAMHRRMPIRLSALLLVSLVLASGLAGCTSIDASALDASADVPRVDGSSLDVPSLDAPRTDTPGSDAALDAAPPSDDAADGGAAPSPLTLGASALAQRIHALGPATGTLASSAVSTRAGSVLVVGLARGTWSAAPGAPSDSFGNTYAPLGGTHTYGTWPSSATTLYGSLDAMGGDGHVFSMAWGDIGGAGDEVTLAAVEVRGGTAIEDTSWVERSAATTLSSLPVHTTGPALLVAYWFGTGTVRPAGSAHVATPGSGFTIVAGATGLVSLSTNGYIQVAVATRAVDGAGDYTVTWTTDDEGAQLYLVAVQ